MWPNLRSGIFHNLGLKLLSIVLACIVFAHVVTEKEREVEMLVPLRLTKIPAGMTYLGHPPSDLLIRARGTGKQLLWLKLFNVEARVNVSDAVVGRYQRAFTPADVSLPPGSGVEVVEIVEPRSLSLDFDSVDSRRVKVFANVVGTPASGYAVAGAPLVRPDSVQVTGARQLVDKIELLRTGPVDIANTRQPTVEKVSVDTRDLKVEVSPSEVTVDVPVERLAQHRFEQVPVEILRSSDIRRVASDPGSGSVVVFGPESQLQALAAADIHLRLDARHLRAGRYVLLPRVELAGELSAVSVEPDKFLVTLE
jgi:hypothetical protein